MQIDLLATERKRLPSIAEDHELHAEHFGIEADRCRDVTARQHQVIDALDGQHNDYPDFGQRTICVQRKSAIVPPSSWRETVASQTCVVRPRCAGFAMHVSVPSRAVPRKLVFSSIVVKLSAPGGKCATQPYPHAVSASATIVAACK